MKGLVRLLSLGCVAVVALGVLFAFLPAALAQDKPCNELPSLKPLASINVDNSADKALEDLVKELTKRRAGAKEAGEWKAWNQDAMELCAFVSTHLNASASLTASYLYAMTVVFNGSSSEQARALDILTNLEKNYAGTDEALLAGTALRGLRIISSSGDPKAMRAAQDDLLSNFAIVAPKLKELDERSSPHVKVCKEYLEPGQQQLSLRAEAMLMAASVNKDIGNRAQAQSLLESIRGEYRGTQYEAAASARLATLNGPK